MNNRFSPSLIIGVGLLIFASPRFVEAIAASVIATMICELVKKPASNK